MPGSRPDAIIALRHVSKTHVVGSVAVRALSDVSLTITRGEYVAVTGPSGCGKTTLLSILGLLDTVSSGEYVLCSDKVDSLNAAQRSAIRNQRIGFIFQAFNLIGDMTLLENVALPLTYRDISPRERHDRVREALDCVGLLELGMRYPGQLSGGQQQRVAVARALVGEPAILLADEPTGNLDSHNGDVVLELLSDLHASGSTICVVTHDLRHRAQAERVVHLLDGHLVTGENGAW